MTLCPIALVAGCARGPTVRICPLQQVLGDVPRTSPPPEAAAAAPRAQARRK